MGGGVVDELPKVRPHGGFAAADVDVEHLHAFQLVDDVLALPRGQLARIALARRRQAVHAGQVAGVGELPGQADRRVQTVLELLDQPGHGCDRCGRRSAGSSAPRVTSILDCGQHAERVQVRRLLRVVDSRRRGKPTGVGVSASDLTTVDDRAVLQKRQLAGAEVIQQRTERLGPHRHLGVQSPAEVRVERRRAGDVAPSVDPAHAVDRYLFDQGLGDESLVSVPRPAGSVPLDCPFVASGLDNCDRGRK